MIKIENVSVAGFEAAVRGLRNPMNSWAKSDSHVGLSGSKWTYDPGYIIGPEDEKLMRKLAKGGPVHAKYRRMIVVYFDMVAPTYLLKDLDTYKIGTVRNSTSTMHKIHSRDLTRDDFSYEHLLEPSDDSLTAVTVDGEICHYSPIGMLDMTIKTLNHFRQKFVETGDKAYWWQMIQLLPMSYNYRSTFMFNYEVLAAIYRDRKDHKLDEWRDFCKWIESLPYSWIITGDKEEKMEPDPEPLPPWPKERPRAAKFVCHFNYDELVIDPRLNANDARIGLYLGEEKIGNSVCIRYGVVLADGFDVVFELLPGSEFIAGCTFDEFNHGISINGDEDEIMVMLYRKE